jgi:type I restriction enzyme S subunit
VYDGPHATPRKTETGPWFLSISSLKDGRLDLTESAHLSDEDFLRWTRRVQPVAGDVLFSYETRLGEAALMPTGITACLGRRMGLLRPKRDVLEPRFLLYAFLGPDFQRSIEQGAVRGATVDRIPINRLGSWPLRLPSLTEQRAIAEVLGALDDMIALNEQIAEGAERLAQALYSYRTLLPGTRRIPLGSAGDWLSGGTPSTSCADYWGGDLPWISATSLRSFYVGSSDRCLTAAGAVAGTKVVPAWTVLMIVRGMSLKSEFRVGITQRSVAFGQDCKALLVKPEFGAATVAVGLRASASDVLLLVDEAGHGTGRLQTDRLERLSLALPPPDSAAALEADLRHLTASGAAAMAETAVLSRLRDVLLPTLLSGRLRVATAAELTGEAV